MASASRRLLHLSTPRPLGRPAKNILLLPRVFQPTIRTQSFASSQPPKKKNPFPLVPLLAIFFGGSAGFYYLVQGRKETHPAKAQMPKKIVPPQQHIAAAKGANGPAFSSNEVDVIYVLGGPGAGKGTQCANLVRDYGFVHLSAGDLLRAEQNRPGSEFGELINTYIKEGKIVPMEVTVQLIKNAMKDAVASEGKYKFLIDGFPRKLDQAHKFEEEVCVSKFTLFFDCPEDVMLKRLLKRGETSGRVDDNIESIKKRFKTFTDTSYPVIEHYRKLGKVIDVPAVDTPEEVYSHVKAELKGRLEGVSTP